MVDWGSNYGWGILTQKIIEGKQAEILISWAKPHLELINLKEAKLERRLGRRN